MTENIFKKFQVREECENQIVSEDSFVHWAKILNARDPGRNCDVNKRRFYKEGRVVGLTALCHMNTMDTSKHWILHRILSRSLWSRRENKKRRGCDWPEKGEVDAREVREGIAEGDGPCAPRLAYPRYLFPWMLRNSPLADRTKDIR